MTSVASGKVVRVDISEMSGFAYGIVMLEGSNGTMEFRYDMSSRGPVPVLGSYATIKYVEGGSRRILEIKPAPDGTVSAMSAPMSASALTERASSSSVVTTSTPPASTPLTDSAHVTPPSLKSVTSRAGPSAPTTASLPPRGASTRGPEIEGGTSGYVTGTTPRVSPTKVSGRPEGVSLITGLMLITALLALMGALAIPSYSWLSPVFFLTSMIMFVISVGFYNMKEWARLLVIVASIIISLTIVGLMISVPLIWYCTRQDIKSAFKS